jgi:excisionase family DNA binding protein
MSWITRGVLPATKLHHQWRIDPGALAATRRARHARGVVPRWRANPPRAGRSLRQLREAAGLGQLDLERACGLSNEAISHLERGHYSPSGATVQRLAQVLDVTPELFVSDESIGGLSLLTAREAASRLDVPIERVHEWLKAGILPAHKVSRQWRVPALAVAELERSGRLRGKSRRLDPRYRGNGA